MKRLTLAIATLGVAATAIPAAASAAPYPAQWQPINQRQANLERRIDAGVRNGALTRREAVRLRAEYRQIAALEQRYRRGGLDARERRDLDQRMDLLSARVRYDRHDRQHRR